MCVVGEGVVSVMSFDNDANMYCGKCDVKDGVSRSNLACKRVWMVQHIEKLCRHTDAYYIRNFQCDNQAF